MPDAPLYLALKSWMPTVVSKPVVLFLFGFCCQMVSVLVLRWPLRRFRTLAIGLTLSVGVEVMDSTLGSDVVKSLRDLLKVNTIPLLLVLAARSGRLLVDDPSPPAGADGPATRPR